NVGHDVVIAEFDVAAAGGTDRGGVDVALQRSFGCYLRVTAWPNIDPLNEAAPLVRFRLTLAIDQEELRTSKCRKAIAPVGTNSSTQRHQDHAAGLQKRVKITRNYVFS